MQATRRRLQPGDLRPVPTPRTPYTTARRKHGKPAWKPGTSRTTVTLQESHQPEMESSLVAKRPDPLAETQGGEPATARGMSRNSAKGRKRQFHPARIQVALKESVRSHGIYSPRQPVARWSCSLAATYGGEAHRRAKESLLSLAFFHKSLDL